MQHFGNNYRYQDDNATSHYGPWFPSVGQRHQHGAACKIARLQPHRTYMGWIGPCNHQYGQPVPEYWWPPLTPVGWMGRNPCRMPATPYSMPWHLAAIIEARGGNTWYWPNIHITTPTGSIMKKEVYSTRFSTVTALWHLGMLIQPLSPISMSSQTYRKYTLNTIVHNCIVSTSCKLAATPLLQHYIHIYIFAVQVVAIYHASYIPVER